MSAAGVVAFALAIVAVVPATAAPTQSPRRAPNGSAFYRPPDPLPAANPGDLIWSVPVASVPGAKAWKILYHSRSVDGADVAVSGVVVTPTNKAPAGGRPVVSMAHGTRGIADKCAPSRSADSVSQIPAIKKLMKQGYVVVATDYEGLGTPGTHPYLVGQSEAHGVLDIARAAHHLPDTAANNQTIVWGQSQGGQAALFTGEVAPAYAPELHLLGVVSGAPVTDVASMYPAAATIPATLGFVVMALIGIQAAHPDARVSDILTPAALEQAKIVEQKCYADVLTAFNKPVDQVIAHNPLDVAPWPELFAADSTGNTATAAPMFVYQGLSDGVVYKIFTDKFVKKACGLGDTLQYQTFSGKDHYQETDAAQTHILAWIQSRLTGQPAPSTCSPA
jgi:hypothetical protein